MTVSYHKRCDGTLVPDYMCQRDGINTGTPPCQNICGSGVDAAVASLVLDALTPLAIQTALQVTAQLQAQAEQADALRATHVQRARHAADAARRRYLAVDPANRLVADALEADWNARLRDLADAEEDYQRAREQAAGPLTDAQLGHIRALAADLPALWHNPATSMKDRKRLIRLLVTDVTLLKDGDTITAHVRLPGGQDRTLTVPRPLTAWEAHTTPEATVALISSLLDEHPFDQIASILNQRGITGGWGRPCTVHSLAAVCRARGIPGHSERLRAAGYLTAAETAAALGVTIPTIGKWQRAGLLDGRRTDGRGTCLFPPGQTRPVTGTARIARDRAAPGSCPPARRATRRRHRHHHPLAPPRAHRRRQPRPPRIPAVPRRAAAPHPGADHRRRAARRAPRPGPAHRRSARRPPRRRPLHHLQVVPARPHQRRHRRLPRPSPLPARPATPQPRADHRRAGRRSRRPHMNTANIRDHENVRPPCNDHDHSQDQPEPHHRPATQPERQRKEHCETHAFVIPVRTAQTISSSHRDTVRARVTSSAMSSLRAHQS